MSRSICSRPQAHDAAKLSWDETAREMAAAHESWQDWEVTVGDGLAALPWEPDAVKRSNRLKRERE